MPEGRGERGEDDVSPEDVAQVLDLLRRVRLENSELKRNFESLKGIHLQLSSAHQQLQGQYTTLHEEKVHRESQLQMACDALRAEAEEKQRQLTATRAQVLKPKDVELLKVKILEEVEAPLKQKAELLAQEADDAQAKLAAMRRQCEELQGALKSLETRTATQLELQAAEHLSEITHLKDKLAALGNPHAKLAALEAKAQSVEREREKLAFTVSRLQDELTQIRRQKEKAVVDKEAVANKIERKVKDIQAEELQLHGLVESLTRKNRHLQRELNEAHRANEEQFGTLMRVQTDRSALQEQLDAFRKAAALEKQTAAQQYQEAFHRLEEKLEATRCELHERERQIAELHISNQEHVSRMTEAHDARLAAAEAAAAEKLRVEKEARHELQAKLDTLRDVCEEYRKECEDFKRKELSRVNVAQREAQRLQAVAGESERQAVGRTMELQQLRRDMEALRVENSNYEVTVAALTRRRDELETQVTLLQAEAECASERHQALVKELEEARKALDSTRAQAVQAVEAVRNTAATERAALGKKYQLALQEAAAQYIEVTKRLRRKLKATRAELAAAMDEMTELRFKNHELQSSSLPVLGSPGHLGKRAPAAQSTLSSEFASSMTALKERQQAYLQAAAGMAKASTE